MNEENKQIQTADSAAEELDVFGASNKLAQMWNFIRENLQKGIDYMSIGGGKPTLLKSGAEKMNILVGYAAEYEKIKEIMNPQDRFYHVEVKCTLRNKEGRKVAECLASCNNKEKAREKLSFADSLNPVLKIAEKRAYVGATLNANALSQFYTQDLEDEAEKKDSNGAVLCCSGCGNEIAQNVAKFSSERFGKLLCRNCQGKVE